MNPTIHDARRAVLAQLAAAHDAWAEREMVLMAEGRYTEAQGAHTFALRVLRAYQSEADEWIDPPTHEHSVDGCPGCEA